MHKNRSQVYDNITHQSFALFLRAAVWQRGLLPDEVRLEVFQKGYLLLEIRLSTATIQTPGKILGSHGISISTSQSNKF